MVLSASDRPTSLAYYVQHLSDTYENGRNVAVSSRFNFSCSVRAKSMQAIVTDERKTVSRIFTANRQ